MAGAGITDGSLGKIGNPQVADPFCFESGIRDRVIASVAQSRVDTIKDHFTIGARAVERTIAYSVREAVKRIIIQHDTRDEAGLSLQLLLYSRYTSTTTQYTVPMKHTQY